MLSEKLEKLYSKADKHSDDILKKTVEAPTLEETSILKLFAKIVLCILALPLFLLVVDVIYVYVAIIKTLQRIARIIELCHYKHISRKYGL